MSAFVRANVFSIRTYHNLEGEHKRLEQLPTFLFGNDVANQVSLQRAAAFKRLFQQGQPELAIMGALENRVNLIC
jgi:hypothetical protein